MAARAIDVDAARAATPGCEERAFLLSTGSSLPTRTTLDAVVGHLRREAEIGGYAAADEIADVLRQGRADLAALVGGRAHEVALATSDTAAWVKAWWGWVAGGNVPAGSAVRLRGSILDAAPRGDGALYRLAVTIEVRGAAKPAVAAEVLFLALRRPAPASG